MLISHSCVLLKFQLHTFFDKTSLEIAFYSVSSRKYIRMGNAPDIKELVDSSFTPAPVSN